MDRHNFRPRRNFLEYPVQVFPVSDIRLYSSTGAAADYFGPQNFGVPEFIIECPEFILALIIFGRLLLKCMCIHIYIYI